MLVDQEFRQCREQLSLLGGLRQPHVVDRFDQADAEEIGPHAVGDRAAEIWIFRCREPLGQHFAPVAQGIESDRFAIQGQGRLRPAGARLDQSPSVVEKTVQFPSPSAFFTCTRLNKLAMP